MQTRRHSFLETCTDVGTGFVGAVAITYFVLPVWGYEPEIISSIEITLIHTAFAIVRKYMVRRWFNRIGE